MAKELTTPATPPACRKGCVCGGGGSRGGGEGGAREPLARPGADLKFWTNFFFSFFFSFPVWPLPASASAFISFCKIGFICSCFSAPWESVGWASISSGVCTWGGGSGEGSGFRISSVCPPIFLHFLILLTIGKLGGGAGVFHFCLSFSLWTIDWGPSLEASFRWSDNPLYSDKSLNVGETIPYIQTKV